MFHAHIQMPANPVLFHIGASSWTLGGALLVFAAVLFVAWLGLLPALARRCGEVRRLTTEEAATLSLVGHEPNYVQPRPIVNGPAAGEELGVTITIGGLRSAWQKKQLGVFFGLPAHGAAFFLAFGIAGLGWGLILQEGVLVLMTLGIALVVISLFLFMMWAAIYTKLN